MTNGDVAAEKVLNVRLGGPDALEHGVGEKIWKRQKTVSFTPELWHTPGMKLH